MKDDTDLVEALDFLKWGQGFLCPEALEGHVPQLIAVTEAPAADEVADLCVKGVPLLLHHDVVLVGLLALEGPADDSTQGERRY